MTDLILIRSFH